MSDDVNKTYRTTTTSSSTSGNSGLAFIVGGLVVAVAVLAFIMYAGGDSEQSDVNVTIEGAGDAAAAVEGAADAVGDAAGDAAAAVEGAAEGN